MQRVIHFFIIIFLLGANFACASQERKAKNGERSCFELGWKKANLPILKISRQFFWKAPAGAWTKGALIIMHGGGGNSYQWCQASQRLLAPQTNFSELAIKQGFAVFVLDSTDQVTDNEGRSCGKIWDDEVRNRENIDLPFIEHVIKNVIPTMRPENSRNEIFMTGHSSGGYMTARASTHFNNFITAFAPVSSGDPYGWHRVCEKGLTLRKLVHGAGFDNETGKQIIENDACTALEYPHEKPWDDGGASVKPVFRIFHHKSDGINNPSCGNKIRKQLRIHGYSEVEPYLLDDKSRPSLWNHLWQEDYNQPILDFFAKIIASKRI